MGVQILRYMQALVGSGQRIKLIASRRVASYIYGLRSAAAYARLYIYMQFSYIKDRDLAISY